MTVDDDDDDDRGRDRVRSAAHTQSTPGNRADRRIQTSNSIKNSPQNQDPRSLSNGSSTTYTRTATTIDTNEFVRSLMVMQRFDELIFQSRGPSLATRKTPLQPALALYWTIAGRSHVRTDALHVHVKQSSFRFRTPVCGFFFFSYVCVCRRSMTTTATISTVSSFLECFNYFIKIEINWMIAK